MVSVLLVAFLICSLEMGSKSQISFGYTNCSGVSSGGLGGKKVFASILLFSSLVVAEVSCPLRSALRTGILDLPPSPARDEVYLCAVQMSGSSAFSSQSRQCCLLVCSRLLWNFLLASFLSAWVWCSGQFLYLLALLPFLLASCLSLVSSFVHHFFAFIPSSAVGTSSLMVSCRVSVSFKHEDSISFGKRILVGGPTLPSLASRAFSNFSQSTLQKFLGGAAWVRVRLRSRVVRIRRWSVFIPGVFSRALQVIIESVWSSEMNTWSSLLHFFVTLCKWVGMPGGSARSIPNPATALIRTSVLSSADFVNSLVSVGLSQCGWCRLKSPIHMIGLGFSVFHPEGVIVTCVNASSWVIVSFLLQSLYMLNRISSPQLPLSCTIVTSPEGKSICFQCSISILLLIRIRERVYADLCCAL